MQLKFPASPEPPPPEEPRIYAVREIVQLASRQLESRFDDVWVEGEVSNLKRPSSGHLYFTLKDARAQLAVVLFRSAQVRLRFALEDGQKLRCRGRLGIWDAQGKFQLTASTAEPVGAGALQLALEQLRRKLEAEGLFLPERKRPLPRLPRTIAVVTSPTGAALHDIVRVLHDRCPVRVVVCPTAVQGEEAPAELVAALRRADGLGADLIILGRGGGSIEDLWAFNSEALARAIFAARTPIISAVGHEVDVTLADLVADLRAPTPTAAAELAVPVFAELQRGLEADRRRLHRAARERLHAGALALERLRRQLGSPLARLGGERQRLDESRGAMEAALRRALLARRQELGRTRERLAAVDPILRLTRGRAVQGQLEARLHHALRHQLERGRLELARAAAQLEALSPLAVLSRGYALVRGPTGAVVREAASLRPNDPLQVRLHHGEIACRVTGIKPVDD